MDRKSEYQMHGMGGTPVYKKWDSMRQRCYNINHKSYHRYGGRGIEVYDKWRFDFQAWYNYVMSLPSAGNVGLSIDRVENDKGYFPGNLQWATRREQQTNRSSTGNKSGFTGVSFSKERNKWESEITVMGKRTKFGRFDSIIEAAEARNNYIIKHGLWEYPIQQTKVA